MQLELITEDPQIEAAALDEELIVDSFAGGGGASEGIRWALGRGPDIAINHDELAIAQHRANHPETRHIESNIWQVDPEIIGPRRVGLLWASPDCTHHSKAKGGKPVKRHKRDLAWVIVQWAKVARPRVIILENVEEFKDWGPLNAEGKPCPIRKGQTFKKWVGKLKRHGYRVECSEIRSYVYNTPTIRKRLYVIARCDGRPIVWPEATHGTPSDPAVIAGRRQIYPTAAKCIDWDLPCPSIFDTSEQIRELYGIRAKRPLADKTLKRIARGVMRYVVDAAEPFIVPVTHAGDYRSNSINEPLRTQTTAKRGEHALVMPFVAGVAHGDGQGRGHAEWPLDEPLRTVTASGDKAIVSPILAGVGGRAGQSPERSTAAPFATLTAKPDTVLVAPFVTKFRSGATGHPINEPLATVTANGESKRPGGAVPLGLVAASLVQTGYGEREGQAPRSLDIQAPLGTQVAGACKHALVAAHISRQFGASVGHDADQPLGTVTSGGAGKSALVSAFLAQHNDGPRPGKPGHDVREPVSTVTTAGSQQNLVQADLIAAHQINLKGSDRRDSEMTEPVPAICAGGNHAGQVYAFLQSYYGTEQASGHLDRPMPTDTARDRFGLVTVEVEGQTYVIVDIGMRMLTPRERYRAQGFPDDYIIDHGIGPDGEVIPLSKEAQGRACGNSVCPPVAAALVAANVPEMAIAREAAE